jgi:stalled ribosome rescue protein Dom34
LNGKQGIKASALRSLSARHIRSHAENGSGSEQTRELDMKKALGLWIDHERAVVVTLLEKTEEIKHIPSNAEKHIRYSGGKSEDNRDNRLEEQLSKYYDEVISHLHDADFILIMGPGEAKVELQKRLEDHKHTDCHLVLKTTDKMTDHQIVKKLRDTFETFK